MSRQIVDDTASETPKQVLYMPGFKDVLVFNCKSCFPAAYIDTKRNKQHMLFHIHTVRHPKHSCLLIRNVI